MNTGSTPINVLVIEPRSEDGDLLLSSLEENFLLSSESSAVRSFHEALMSLSNSELDFVFISENLPKPALESFLSDIAKIKAKKKFGLIYVKDTVWPQDDRFAQKGQGFECIVQRKLVDADQQVLTPIVHGVMHQKEVNVRIAEMEKSLGMLFKELDLVAGERKRGWQRKFNTISADYIDQLSKFDPEIMERYFEILAERLTNSDGVAAEVRASSPECSEENTTPEYRGASSRVWKKLLKSHNSEPEKE